MFQDNRYPRFTPVDESRFFAYGGYLADLPCSFEQLVKVPSQVGAISMEESPKFSYQTLEVGKVEPQPSSAPAPTVRSMEAFLSVCKEVKELEGRILHDVKQTTTIFDRNYKPESSSEDEYEERPKLLRQPQFTIKQKIRVELLRGMIRNMEERVSLCTADTKKESGKVLHKCKICDSAFRCGRQLGGHMSRKHPGKSDTYNAKRLVHRFMKSQRARREYFRKLLRKVPSKSKKEPQKKQKHKEERKATRAKVSKARLTRKLRSMAPVMKQIIKVEQRMVTRNASRLAVKSVSMKTADRRLINLRRRSKEETIFLED